MPVSSIIQGDVNSFKLSEASPIEVVEAPKSVPNEEKFKIAKFKLPVSDNCKRKSETITIKSLCEQVTDIIHSTVQAVGDRKVKVKIKVELLY